MTEYNNEVEKRRDELAHEKWLRQATSLHANNGYLEIRYNNGRVDKVKIR
tara:strand:+ start:50 stop:199 length:150 start_codon:yes stop_codon:yes gene_type:complete